MSSILKATLDVEKLAENETGWNQGSSKCCILYFYFNSRVAVIIPAFNLLKKDKIFLQQLSLFLVD